MELISRVSSFDYFKLDRIIQLTIEGYEGVPIDIVYSIGPALIDEITEKVIRPSFFIANIYIFDSTKEMRDFQISNSHY